MRLRAGWLLLSGMVLSTGCVDRTSAVGEEGRIEYSLITTYDVPQHDLRNARIVTGHRQRLELDLTARGSRDIPSLDLLQHRLTPSLHTQVETDADGNDASVRIAVEDPGVYTLESMLGARVMDAIELRFDRPADFEVLVKVRGPWGDRFRDTPDTGTLTVEEGSQLTVQAVPVDAAGRRLAGTMRTRLDIDPEWAVTPGQGVVEVTEFGVWTVDSDMDFYIVEPGPLSFTMSDSVSGASTTRWFQVTPVGE